MRDIEELLHKDAGDFLKELDEPQELRRQRFDRIIERLERKGLDGSPPPTSISTRRYS
jgi:hypothetical protein